MKILLLIKKKSILYRKGRGQISTVKPPGTAAPSHAKNREIAKGGSEAREMGTGGSREKPVNKGLHAIE